MIGTTLSHYEIREKLGEGGMGVLYRARDTHLDRTVAIKLLRPEAVGDPERKRRFILEAKAASALNHPNIVTIYDIDRARSGSEEVDFIAMECVEGQPLDRLIASPGLPVEKALGYAVQMAGALAAAHAAGIVHRDIKPANVMVSASGALKLLDFGLAKLAERATPADTAPTETAGHRTAHGAVLGTVAYMSPEQAQGKPVDARSDVFSCGAVLYEMLAGRRPFQGDSHTSTLAAILRDAPPPLRALRPDVPNDLERIVLRCLEKAREARYASAIELQKELAECQARLAALSSRSIVPRQLALPVLVLLLAATGIAAWLWARSSRARWARNVALPEIQRLAEKEDYVAAFRLVREAEPYISGDQELERLGREVASPASIHTSPEGAEVRVKPYGQPKAEWLSLGRTPLDEVRVPGHFLRWRLEKEGYERVERALSVWTHPRVEATLTRAGSAPEGMVFVPRGSYAFRNLPEVEFDEFWLDRYEVTNRQFKTFVDAGGYAKSQFWKEPFTMGARPLSWEAAIDLFRDATGRPGPSTWELGTYPTDRADHPVSGVSWFEAAAYVAFAGGSLPTVHHWFYAAGLGAFSDILLFSNFGGSGPAPVGRHAGLARYGTYDIAGNVKEWCWNAVGDKRYILGGAWDEPRYEFGADEYDAQSPFDRSPRNGFRTARFATLLSEPLTRPIAASSDSSLEKPVSDPVFDAYRSFYSYDRGPLEAALASAEDVEQWRRESITFNAGYSGERVLAHLFLPKNAAPPYQVVIHFPGSYAQSLRSSQHEEETWFVSFVIRSGRALLFPVYKGTYERGGGEGLPNHGDLRRDLVIQWSKDLGRSIDYLETRPDIDHERIAYYGFSLGAGYGATLMAVEPRLRASVLLMGGLNRRRDLPEIEAINFAPRARMPVLMVNGRFDFRYPLESAQRPLFRLLGAPEKDKRHVLFDSGHAPPRRQEVMKEILDWLDRYLGPVRLTSARAQP